jgi:hypothetical protein
VAGLDAAAITATAQSTPFFVFGVSQEDTLPNIPGLVRTETSQGMAFYRASPVLQDTNVAGAHVDAPSAECQNNFFSASFAIVPANVR